MPHLLCLIIKVMDELLPKATGFAAKIEKKRARAEQRRAGDISPGNMCT